MDDSKFGLGPSRRNPWMKAGGMIFVGVGMILFIFLIETAVSLRREVAQLENTLVTSRDLANLAVCLGPKDPALAGLEGTCTDCHTVEAFRDSHQLDDLGAEEIVARMSQLAGAHISPEEIPRAEAALTFMKCAHCHTIERLKELAVLNPQKRWEVIVAMMDEPGATISQDDAQRIRDFYGDFWGWHRP